MLNDGVGQSLAKPWQIDFPVKQYMILPTTFPGFRVRPIFSNLKRSHLVAEAKMQIPDKARSSGAGGVKLLRSAPTEFERAEARLDRDGTLATAVSGANEQSARPDRVSSLRLCTPELDRRAFLRGVVVGAAAVAWPRLAQADQQDLDAIRAQIVKRHDEAVQRLQEWIRQPSIAAENRGMSEGCDLTMRLLREAGFV